MPELDLENVTKIYPPNVIGLKELNLRVADGELLALVGPSGCGKTTTLRLIAGLEEPNSGTINIGGRVVNGLPPSARDLAFVFQRPALYPHRNVRDNLGLSLALWQPCGWWSRLSRRGREAAISRRKVVDNTARLLGLNELLDRYPSQLSGGQQQRVALGRGLVRNPRVLLLDEPLSNLDSGLRQELRRELHLLQKTLHATMIYVTHDPLEALSLGDRVAVMERGHLHQVDRPEVIFRRPANRFVAGFVGWPPMNFLDCEIFAENGLFFVVGTWGRMPLPASRCEEWKKAAGPRLTLGIRPEDVLMVQLVTPDALPMQVYLVETLGHSRLLSLTGEYAEMTAWLREDCQLLTPMNTIMAGSKVMVQLRLENCLLFDRASGAAVSASPTG